MNEQNFNVTEKELEESIVQELHLQAGYKTSLCVLILNTGAECVGSFSPVEVTEGEKLDVAANKKKARAAAASKAFAHLKAVAEWRKAVFLSEKARAEQQAKQVAEGEPAKVEEPNQDVTIEG